MSSTETLAKQFEVGTRVIVEQPDNQLYSECRGVVQRAHGDFCFVEIDYEGAKRTCPFLSEYLRFDPLS